MTRKDYENITAAFRSAYKSIKLLSDSPQMMSHAKDGICIASIELAYRLGEDNPRFDREKFLDACTTEPKP